MRAGISFPYLFPLSFWSPSTLIGLLFPSPQSGFFSPVSTARKLQPRNAHRHPREWWRRESDRREIKTETQRKREREGGEGEQGGRRASCYICNIFAFTIFQLVCILEPLLLASTLVLSIFSSSSCLPLRYARTTTGECYTLHLSRLLNHRPNGAIVLSVFPYT